MSNTIPHHLARVMVDQRAVHPEVVTEPPRITSYFRDTEKEVVYEPSKEVYADARYGGLEVNPFWTPEDAFTQEQTAHAPGMSRRRKVVLLGIGAVLVVSIAIIIAAVLATTLGKKTGGSPGAGTGNNTNGESAAQATPVEGAIAVNSSLTANAWLIDSSTGAFVVRVIYQDPNGLLQASSFNTITKRWTKLNDFMRATPGSPMGLTRFSPSIYGATAGVQEELFFLSDDNKTGLREWNWPSGDVTLAGNPGDMNKRNFQAHPASQISAYWPFIMFQDSENNLREIVYEANEHWDRTPGKTDNWTTPVLEGGAISIVPAAQNLSSMNIFYQQEDRTIVTYQRDGKSRVYTRDTRYPSQPVPAKTGMTAFALRNDIDPENSPFKVYSLYQDSDAKIQMVWRNDTASGWHGPQSFPAFDGADNGTSIACVTMFTYLELPIEQWSVPRCFFAVQGAIRQVQLVGDDWETVGTVGDDEG